MRSPPERRVDQIWVIAEEYPESIAAAGVIKNPAGPSQLAPSASSPRMTIWVAAVVASDAEVAYFAGYAEEGPS